jgi:hypothetical protein
LLASGATPSSLEATARSSLRSNIRQRSPD